MEKNKDTAKMMENHFIGQQMQQMQQQLQMLDQQMIELEQLSIDLSELKDQESAKTFSPLGGGIFVESEIKRSDSVLLGVGSNVLVRKPKKDALELVERQKGQLKQIREQMEAEALKLNQSVLSLKQ